MTLKMQNKVIHSFFFPLINFRHFRFVDSDCLFSNPYLVYNEATTNTYLRLEKQETIPRRLYETVTA